LREECLPLFAAADARELTEPDTALPPMTEGGEVLADYSHTGLTLRRHPVSFLRHRLAQAGAVPVAALRTARDGKRLSLAGLVLIRQRPGTAKGVVFMTIEDETGHANLVIWPDLLERQRRIVFSTTLVACRGRVQREGAVIHVVAEELTDLTPWLHRIAGEDETDLPPFRSRDFR
jgi:error-prone DNA polymerase